MTAETMGNSIDSSLIEHSLQPPSPGPAHVIHGRMLCQIFALLVLLTFLTVAAAQLPLGQWEIWISLGIAGVKSLLVSAYFMHLRYDNPFYALLLAGAVLFLVIFLGITLIDVG